MIRYFSPDSSECSRRISVAHRTYSGIDRSSRPTNRTTVFWALPAATCPPMRGQQQGVELAVGGFAGRQRAPGQQHRAGSAGDQDDVQHERESVDPRAPGDDRLVGLELPDRQPQRRSERDERQRRHQLRRATARSRAGPTAEHHHRAPQQRDQRRQRREVDVGAAQVGGGEQRGHRRASSEPLARTAAGVAARREAWPERGPTGRDRGLDGSFAAVQGQLRVERQEQDRPRSGARSRARRTADLTDRPTARRGCAWRG